MKYPTIKEAKKHWKLYTYGVLTSSAKKLVKENQLIWEDGEPPKLKVQNTLLVFEFWYCKDGRSVYCRQVC